MAMAATSYVASYGPNSYSGSGQTPESACIDLLNTQIAVEGGGGYLESVITAPAGIVDACGDEFVTGTACKFATGSPGTPGYCTWYAFIHEITTESTEYIIKIESGTGAPESGATLETIEPEAPTNRLVAKVYNQDGVLVPNVDIRLEVNVSANTGGHQHHDSERPKGSLGGSPQSAHILNGNTGTEGLKFRFTAPAISGDHRIIATCVSDTCKQEGPDEVWVGIKDLVNLGSGPYHVLIGETFTHFDNHYLTREASARLQEMAYFYKMIRFPFNPVLHINDASLERGGLFDINGSWNGPHYEHRRGTVVDIRANHAQGAIPERDYLEFQQLAKEMGMEAKLEIKNDKNNNEIISQRHFHLRIFKRGE